MKTSLYTGIIACLLCAYGCRSYSITERSNDFLQLQKRPEKIMVLPLDFILTNSGETVTTDKQDEEQKGIRVMSQTIKNAFRKIKVEGIFLGQDTDGNTTELFSSLIPLKKDLLTSSELHEDLFKQPRRKTFTTKLFARAPKIQPQYNGLVEKYGTRYVLFAGIFTDREENRHYQYVILADLTRSEILFRNLKYMHAKAVKSNIEPVLYDTFLHLNR